MGDEINKRVIAIFLVIAVILSVIATWKVLSPTPKVTVIGTPQGAPVSLSIGEEAKLPAQPLSVTEGTGVSLNVEESR